MRAGADGHFKQAWLATVSLLLFTTSPLKSCKVKCHVVYSTISPCSPLDGLLKLLTQKLWYSQRLLTSERCSSWSCVVIRSRRFGPSFINHSGSPSVGFFYTCLRVILSPKADCGDEESMILLPTFTLLVFSFPPLSINISSALSINEKRAGHIWDCL